MTDSLDLDARLEALFATAPAEFVATRDALVRELRAEGRDDDAASVKALRRPTVAVAAVNRTAREHKDDVAALLDVGARLTALQADRTADRDELRGLTRERRALLHRLTEAAANATERPDAARTSIAATFDAASLDETLRDDLLRGRITHELSPAARFVASDTAPSPRAAPRRRERTAPAAPPRDELAARRARAELAAVRARAEAAEDSAREHTEAATEAAAAVEAAERRVRDLEAALVDARAAVVDAKRAERDTQRAERRARAEHARTTAALEAAERAVEATEQ
jgi:hypothetical protein